MTYERYAPQSRQNPLVQEAQFIAQEMDYGNSRFAVDRLQQDLRQLQGYPDAQKQLIAMVDNFEQTGRGTDLEAHNVNRNGNLYTDVRAVDYRYVSDGYRTYRQPYSSEPVAIIYHDRNQFYRNGRQYYQQDDRFYGHDGYGRDGYRQGSYYGNDPRNFYQRTPEQQGFRQPDYRYDQSGYRYQDYGNAQDYRYGNPQDYAYQQQRREDAWLRQQEYAFQRQQEIALRRRQQLAWQQEQRMRYGQSNGWQAPGYHRFDDGQDYADRSRRGQRRSHHGHNHGHDHGHDHGRNNRGDRRYSSNQSAMDGNLPRGLTEEATMAFAEAARMAARDGVTIKVTSAGRTYQEQAALYKQLAGKSPVARPGTSNHESGEAIDVKNYAEAKPYLLAAGFVHGDGKGRIKGDPWHFRYMG